MSARNLLSRPMVLMMMTAFLGAPAAQGQMRGSFDDADANHDGRVTLQEFESYATQQLISANGPMAQRFKQLSSQEQAARLRQRFNKKDTGHKGYLDRNDWNGS